MVAIKLEVGNYYRSENNQLYLVYAEISPDSRHYQKGFRFVARNLLGGGMCRYAEDGRKELGKETPNKDFVALVEKDDPLLLSVLGTRAIKILKILRGLQEAVSAQDVLDQYNRLENGDFYKSTAKECLVSLYYRRHVDREDVTGEDGTLVRKYRLTPETLRMLEVTDPHQAYFKAIVTEPLTEVNRFITLDVPKETTHKYIVFVDQYGKYHIDTITEVRDKEAVVRTDVHGAMDKDAYLAWLTNAFFNTGYMQSNGENRKWLMNDE